MYYVLCILDSTNYKSTASGANSGANNNHWNTPTKNMIYKSKGGPTVDTNFQIIPYKKVEGVP